MSTPTKDKKIDIIRDLAEELTTLRDERDQALALHKALFFQYDETCGKLFLLEKELATVKAQLAQDVEALSSETQALLDTRHALTEARRKLSQADTERKKAEDELGRVQNRLECEQSTRKNEAQFQRRDREAAFHCGAQLQREAAACLVSGPNAILGGEVRRMDLVDFRED